MSGLAVPARTDLAASLAHTRLLLALRWRMVRGTRSRLAVLAGLAVLFGAVVAASNVGYFIRTLAEQAQDNALTEFAVTYIVALERGELGAVGAAALGSAVAASLFSPFTGAANVALFAGDDLSGLRPPRLHRYFDSLVTAGVSTIGFVQLLTLTAVGSLLTLDGGRVGGLLFTWALWPVLILAAVAEGWAIEWLHRAVGVRARRAVLTGLGATLALVLALDPQHGKTLFGVGDAYAGTLRAAGRGDLTHLGVAAGVLTLTGVGLFLLGVALCQGALSRPEVVVAGARDRRRLIPIAGNPTVALAQVLVAQIVRTGEIRRPLGTILVLGVPAVWVTGGSDQTMSTLVIAIPLASALAWGVNPFGILGPAMTWLASQPHVLRRLLHLCTGVQVSLTAVVALLCWGPAFLAGRVDGPAVATVTAGLVASTALTARSAAAKSVHRPLLTRLGSRGDAIVPPLTAINYTLRFALGGGLVGVIVLGQGNRQIQVMAVAYVLLWSLARYALLARQWRRRTLQAHVVASVAAA